jgi:hypothetical protein
MALNEKVVVNTGLLKIASGLSVAMVLCHESAHSARNHSHIYEQKLNDYDTQNKAKKDALDKALDTLLAAAYDEGTSTYTHRKADFDKAKPAWDAYWTPIDVVNKTIESEADIVGGQLCADAGFSQDEVVKGFTDLFNVFKTLDSGSTEVAEGEYEVKKDDLATFLQQLFGRQTHPTDDERLKQIARVEEVFKKDGTSPDIAQAWLSGFDAAAAPAMSLSFADGNELAPRFGVGGVTREPRSLGEKAQLDYLAGVIERR